MFPLTIQYDKFQLRERSGKGKTKAVQCIYQSLQCWQNLEIQASAHWSADSAVCTQFLRSLEALSRALSVEPASRAFRSDFSPSAAGHGGRGGGGQPPHKKTRTSKKLT